MGFPMLFVHQTTDLDMAYTSYGFDDERTKSSIASIFKKPELMAANKASLMDQLLPPQHQSEARVVNNADILELCKKHRVPVFGGLLVPINQPAVALEGPEGINKFLSNGLGRQASDTISATLYSCAMATTANWPLGGMKELFNFEASTDPQADYSPVIQDKQLSEKELGKAVTALGLAVSKYIPIFSQVGYDEGLLKTAIMLHITYNQHVQKGDLPSEGLESLEEDVRDISESARLKVFSNGTLEGMIARLGSMWQVARGVGTVSGVEVHKNRDLYTIFFEGQGATQGAPKNTVFMMFLLFEKYLPLGYSPEVAFLTKSMTTDTQPTPPVTLKTAQKLVEIWGDPDFAPMMELSEQDRLESIETLAEIYGCSRLTARVALNQENYEGVNQELLNTYATEGLPMLRLPKFTASSMSGPPCAPNRTKSQTLVASIKAVEMFLTEACALVTRGNSTGVRKFPTVSNETIKAVLARYRYLFAGYLFPKHEVYDREKIKTKTRNIFAASFPAHMFLQRLVEPFEKCSVNMLNAPFYCPSLYKVTFFGTGLVDVLIKMAERAAETGYSNAVYADNYYGMKNRGERAEDEQAQLKERLKAVTKGKVKDLRTKKLMGLLVKYKMTYFSLDMVRGEANAKPDRVALLLAYSILYGYTDTSGSFPDQRFDSSMYWVALTFGPLMAVNVQAIIGTLTLTTPGQGSGNRLTFLVNQVGTAVWSLYFEQNPKLQDFQNLATDLPVLLNECNKRTGIDFSIEHAMGDLALEFLENMEYNNAHAYGVMQVPVSSFKESEHFSYSKTLKLDMLGFGVAYSKQFNSFVTVLDRDRLIDSCVFSKSDVDLELDKAIKATDATQQRKVERVAIANFMRTVTLYSIGGWTSPVLSVILSKRVADFFNTILGRESSLDISRVPDDVTGTMSHDPFWTRMLQEISAPGLEELFHETKHFRTEGVSYGVILLHRKVFNVLKKDIVLNQMNLPLSSIDEQSLLQPGWGSSTSLKLRDDEPYMEGESGNVYCCFSPNLLVNIKPGRGSGESAERCSAQVLKDTVSKMEQFNSSTTTVWADMEYSALQQRVYGLAEAYEKVAAEMRIDPSEALFYTTGSAEERRDLLSQSIVKALGKSQAVSIPRTIPGEDLLTNYKKEMSASAILERLARKRKAQADREAARDLVRAPLKRRKGNLRQGLLADDGSDAASSQSEEDPGEQFEDIQDEIDELEDEDYESGRTYARVKAKRSRLLDQSDEE